MKRKRSRLSPIRSHAEKAETQPEPNASSENASHTNAEFVLQSSGASSLSPIERSPRSQALIADVDPGVAQASDRVHILITGQGWENTKDGLRPRIVGEITLPEGTSGSRQVEFWVNVNINGKSIGYNNLRVPVRAGVGRFDEVFFLYETAATLNNQSAFDLSIENIVLLEVPEFDLEIDEDPELERPSKLLTKNR